VDAGGVPHERVHDVAGRPGPDGVDPETCRSPERGAATLCAVWKDPDFDPAEPAFYYLRVLEKPVCRWSTLQCRAAGVDPFDSECPRQAEAATARLTPEAGRGVRGSRSSRERGASVFRMTLLAMVLVALFALVGLACLVGVLVGLPGTWILLALAAGVELVDARLGGPAETFGWELLLLGAGLALLGEIVEAVSGAVGARLGGASRRGMVGALLGGILGAIFFTPLLPVPVVGTLVGAVIGTFAGAWIGEATGPARRTREETLRASVGAVLGSLFGRVGKLVPGIAVWVLLVRAAWP